MEENKNQHGHNADVGLFHISNKKSDINYYRSFDRCQFLSNKQQNIDPQLMLPNKKSIFDLFVRFAYHTKYCIQNQ